MKILSRLALAIGCGLLLAQCASTPSSNGNAGGGNAQARKSESKLAHRLAPGWIAGAKVMKVSGFAVYYHGKTEPPMPQSGGTWCGPISGEILLVSKEMAILCQNLTVRSNHTFELTTPSLAILAGGSADPRWKHLITQ